MKYTHLIKILIDQTSNRSGLSGSEPILKKPPNPTKKYLKKCNWLFVKKRSLKIHLINKKKKSIT